MKIMTHEWALVLHFSHSCAFQIKSNGRKLNLAVPTKIQMELLRCNCTIIVFTVPVKYNFHFYSLNWMHASKWTEKSSESVENILTDASETVFNERLLPNTELKTFSRRQFRHSQAFVSLDRNWYKDIALLMLSTSICWLKMKWLYVIFCLSYYDVCVCDIYTIVQLTRVDFISLNSKQLYKVFN